MRATEPSQLPPPKEQGTVTNYVHEHVVARRACDEIVHHLVDYLT